MQEFESRALECLRRGWLVLTQQWDEMRRDHPEQDDLITVLTVHNGECALMARKKFLQQFRPPSGFEHLLRPAGELDPPRRRDTVMWVLCLGENGRHITLRIARNQALAVEMPIVRGT